MTAWSELTRWHASLQRLLEHIVSHNIVFSTGWFQERVWFFSGIFPSKHLLLIAKHRAWMSSQWVYESASLCLGLDIFTNYTTTIWMCNSQLLATNDNIKHRKWITVTKWN